MAKKNLNTVKEVLFWSYANLAMAHTAVEREQQNYVPFNYMIRAKLFKGLIEETMNIRTLFECSINDMANQEHPFKIEYIPVSYPKPRELVLIID